MRNEYIFGMKFKVFFIIGVIIMILSPIILTLPAFYEKFDFSHTGQIGDTIGGLTAPIITFIGALLVYVSFREQVHANKLLNIENSRRLILDLIFQLKQDIDRFEFELQVTEADVTCNGIIKNTFKGHHALTSFFGDLKKSFGTRDKLIIDGAIFAEVYFLLNQFIIIIERLNNIDLSKHDLELISNSLRELFIARFDTHIHLIANARKESPDDPIARDPDVQKIIILWGTIRKYFNI